MLYVKKKEEIDVAKASVVFSKDNEYYTPKYVVDFFYPDGFDYDPATCEGKAKEFGVPYYDTIETDGLAQDWTKYDRIWINPPFTEKHKFLAKAGCHCKLFIPRGRINFESGLGKEGKSPAFGSVVIRLADENTIEYIDLKDISTRPKSDISKPISKKSWYR